MNYRAQGLGEITTVSHGTWDRLEPYQMWENDSGEDEPLCLSFVRRSQRVKCPPVGGAHRTQVDAKNFADRCH